MFAELMEKADKCCRKAVALMKNGEADLARFFLNASVGYKEKALNLEVGE